MSFNYDRSYNLTGDATSAATGLAFIPSYGTSVTITNRKSLNEFGDGYFAQIPLGINDFEMQFDFNFRNKNENDTYDIVSFFESLNGTGVFNYTDNARIYSTKELYVESLQSDFVAPNKTDISATCYSDTFSIFLDYKKTVLNTNNPQISDWQNGQNYFIDDIVFDISKTGSAEDLTDLFYYCTQNHTAGAITTDNSDYWTQQFEWQPNQPLSIANRIKTSKKIFRNSYATQTNLGINNQVFQTIQFNYSSIEDRKLRAILHFLLTHYGRKKFIYSFPKLFNVNKYWVLERIEHTYKYFNLHDLTVSLRESLPPIKDE